MRFLLSVREGPFFTICKKLQFSHQQYENILICHVHGIIMKAEVNSVHGYYPIAKGVNAINMVQENEADII